MIPRIIHYCWFGRGQMPESALKCLESWHQHMPDWEYMLWDEDSFDLSLYPYAREAYEARKFAFVSDVARLYALKEYGGVYLDTDVLVYRSFDPLLDYPAFAGFEGSKYLPIGTCVIASKAHGEWVTEQFEAYQDRHFLLAKGSFDLTTNVQFITAKMQRDGFIQNGKEQDYKDLHVFPVEFFCPRLTTGEYIRTKNTYCDHLGIGSWSDASHGWKVMAGGLIGQKNMTRLIKLKRRLFG